MKSVSVLSHLGDKVRPFVGKTVDDAIKAAEDWAARNNRQLRGNYFLQIKIGQSESIICDIEPINETLTRI